jgi:hypothetical protein
MFAKLNMENKDLELLKQDLDEDLVSIAEVKDRSLEQFGALEKDVKELKDLIDRAGTDAFCDCLSQILFLNPRIKLNLKGVHPLHGVKDKNFYNISYFSNPILVDLENSQLQAFDPLAPPPP